MKRGTLGAIGLALAVGCASRQPAVKPDDMSAEQHRAQAQHERELARQDVSHYDPNAGRVDVAPPPPRAFNDGVEFPVSVYNPTERYLRAADKHRAHAREHEKAAAALDKFEAGECKMFPVETRAACPLLGPVDKIEDVARGVRVTFTAGTRVDAVAAHMRCHYAYARARGFDERVSCPLYMPGIEITEAGAAAVDLTTRDPAKVAELRARSREEAVFSHATP
jgi:hypothetical protein